MNKQCKSILAIDDDPEMLESVSLMLELESYSVIKAENGQIALNILSQLRPDQLPCCIILDLMMPVMSGINFLKIVNQEHKDDWAKIPVIVVTALGASKEVKSLPLVIKVIEKPYEAEELLGSIVQHCGTP